MALGMFSFYALGFVAGEINAAGHDDGGADEHPQAGNRLPNQQQFVYHEPFLRFLCEDQIVL